MTLFQFFQPAGYSKPNPKKQKPNKEQDFETMNST